MKLVDSSEMGEIDRKTIEDYGIPPLILMENAGFRIWKRFVQDFDYSKNDSFIFLSGRGNNGGDACVMARQAFTDGFVNIIIVSWGSRPGDERTGQKEYCRSLGIPLLQWEDDQAEIVDALARGSVIFDGINRDWFNGPPKT